MLIAIHQPPRVLALTYAVRDDLQQVLCEQQVGQSQQAVHLRRELLQPVLRDIQTDQSL